MESDWDVTVSSVILDVRSLFVSAGTSFGPYFGCVHLAYVATVGGPLPRLWR